MNSGSRRGVCTQILFLRRRKGGGMVQSANHASPPSFSEPGVAPITDSVHTSGAGILSMLEASPICSSRIATPAPQSGAALGIRRPQPGFHGAGIRGSVAIQAERYGYSENCCQRGKRVAQAFTR